MISILRRFKQLFAVAAIGMAVSLVAVDFAEARRGGGGFGSRGSRTHAAPATTNTAPGPATNINRSMTPNTQANAAVPAAGAAQGASKPGMFGGMAGGLLGGLALGGLLGMMMGNGFGGMAGMLGMLLQIALIGGLAMLAFRFFARRQQAAGGDQGGAASNNSRYQAPKNDVPRNNAYEAPQGNQGGFQIPKIGGMGAGSAAGYAAAPRKAGSQTDEIGITPRDFNQFEKMLIEIQGAYANEDYAKLRSLTTPEAMSYLAEELGENATNGLKNEVRDVTLLQGDLSEAWREDGKEYATVAMRYSSIDVMRDRNTGALAQGNVETVGESTEIWTFVRTTATEWKLSAIQSVE